MLTSRTLFTWKQKADTVGAVEERTKHVGHLPGAGKGGTRPASSGSWLSMEVWRRRHVAELWRR